MISAEDVKKHFGLVPLPEEGGFYHETYRSTAFVSAEVFEVARKGRRNLSTAIYYLITDDEFSAIHRVPGDEIFHFYAGDPAEMLVLQADGAVDKLVLGSDFLRGQKPQYVVKALSWQGLRLGSGGKWALLGATLSPGFAFKDFEVGQRSLLIDQYPTYAKEIALYTRD